MDYAIKADWRKVRTHWNYPPDPPEGDPGEDGFPANDLAASAFMRKEKRYAGIGGEWGVPESRQSRTREMKKCEQTENYMLMPSFTEDSGAALRLYH